MPTGVEWGGQNSSGGDAQLDFQLTYRFGGNMTTDPPAPFQVPKNGAGDAAASALAGVYNGGSRHYTALLDEVKVDFECGHHDIVDLKVRQWPLGDTWEIVPNAPNKLLLPCGLTAMRVTS